MRSRRPARPLLSVLLTATVALGLTGAAATAADGSPARHPAGTSRTDSGRAAQPTTPSALARSAATPGVHYAVDRPLCRQPKGQRRMRCYALRRVTTTADTPGAYRYRTSASGTRGPVGGYTPTDLARAYGFDPHVARRNTTVAVVMWHNAPRVRHDLDVFDKHYGFRQETKRSLRVVNQAGHAGPLPNDDRYSSSEVALDVQTIRAVCRTCRILVVEADRSTDASLATAVNTAVRMGAGVVNNSYGEPEYRVSKRIRNAYDHPGTVMVASAGDDGWYGWDFMNRKHGKGDSKPSFPASSPDVVAVGGTTLTLSASGRRSSETVWNSNGRSDVTGAKRKRALGASGGGCSTLYAAKPWQRHAPGYAATKCGGKRLVADVAADADPHTGFDVYDSYGSRGWITIGGTSLAAPIISGIYALAGGAHGADYPSAGLYTNSELRPARRYDVTSGGNGYCGGAATADCANAVHATKPATHNPNKLGGGLVDCSFPRHGSDAVNPPKRSECNARSGFDGPTGVGTPTGTSLFSATSPTVSVSFPDVRRPHHRGTFTAHVREPVKGVHATSFHWSWGDGHSTTRAKASATHSYAKPGRYRVTLQVTDSRYQSGQVSRRIRIASR